MGAAQEVAGGSSQGDGRNRVKQGKTKNNNLMSCRCCVELVIPEVGRTGMPTE
jgi:hypothetical protein